MGMGKAFFVVGHEDWGKTRTINKIRKGLKRYNSVLGNNFWIRGMSNDDKAKQYLHFVNKLNRSEKPLLIAALCPNFHNKKRHTAEIINILKSKYELYFWVMLHKYNYDDIVSDVEIKVLKNTVLLVYILGVIRILLERKYLKSF